MLKNYALDENGVIYQVERQKFVYDKAYVEGSYAGADRNKAHGEMSHLRFGYMVGSIGHVPDSVLDVGYGSGDFLKVAKKMVPNVFGNDIPPAYPIDDVTFVEDIYSRHFEVVTFFDCLEHFDNPYDIVNLKADYVCITLPWCHYFSDEWFENWKHRKPNEHLWHFNDVSLRKFFDAVGYDCLNTCNIEDTIRRPSGDWKNILAGVFRKRK